MSSVTLLPLFHLTHITLPTTNDNVACDAVACNDRGCHRGDSARDSQGERTGRDSKRLERDLPLVKRIGGGSVRVRRATAVQLQRHADSFTHCIAVAVHFGKRAVFVACLKHAAVAKE